MGETYKHGLLWQDHQHEQLLSCMASLNKKRDTDLEGAELKKVLAFLEQYAKSHFDLEMSYMKELKYPEIDKHQQQHDKFIQMVLGYKQKASSSKDSSELITDLCNWLKEHIMGIDKDLALFIMEKTKNR